MFGGATDNPYVQQIIQTLSGPLGTILNIVFWAATIIFAIRGGIAIIPYFSAKDAREKQEAKERFIGCIAGVGFSLVGLIIINLILNVFGTGMTLGG